MDVRAPSLRHLPPAGAAWRRGGEERRGSRPDRRRVFVDHVSVEAPAPALGPAPAFMAQVLGQSTLGACPGGGAVYAQTRQTRYACGVCADERA